MRGHQSEVAEIGFEFHGAELRDRRREWRLLKLAEALAKDPDASLPTATRTVAGLEAAYRLLGNEAVTVDGILAGHYEQTVERAAAEGLVLAIHDTSIFKFSGDAEREGLGPLRGKGQGFLGHLTLLVAPGETRKPLGVTSLQTVVRKKRQGRRPVKRPLAEDGEAIRWLRGVETTEERLGARCGVVHVMDREADSYDLLARLITAGSRFVVRSNHDRLLEGEKEHLLDAVAKATTVVEREVVLSRRKQEKIVFNRRRRPARAGRLARLAISAVTVRIRRPPINDRKMPESLALNVVHVREVETHGENAPVEWTLLTTEPIETAKDIERVVDYYRARWTIEEYFKAIKTGCAYQKRQLESIAALLNALAIFIPIAWRLLLLRTLSRATPDVPATQALTKTQLQVLVAASHKRVHGKLTVRQAMLAIAALGGHIPNNGDPGWQVLGRGFEHLLMLERGWNIARNRTSDQS